MSTVPVDFTIELLDNAPVEATVAETSAMEMIVEFGNVTIEGVAVQQPEIIEVFSMPPTGGGYDRVEVLAFTKQGTLSAVTVGASEFPIAGGTFVLESVAARVVTAPTGSPVVLDVLRNNVSIYGTPANRPTIQPGFNNAGTVIPPGTMFADGDYLEVHIVSVGSTTPGTTLTASIRLARVG